MQYLLVTQKLSPYGIPSLVTCTINSNDNQIITYQNMIAWIMVIVSTSFDKVVEKLVSVSSNSVLTTTITLTVVFHHGGLQY